MNEKELESLRQSVQDIDQNLASLLEKRLQVSQAIGKHKLKARKPLYDAAQDERHIHELSELLEKASQRGDVIKWVRRLRDIGRKVQTALVMKAGK